MWQKMRQFLFGLLYEQNEPSLTRVIIAASFLVFVLGTAIDIILAIHHINWPDYTTFATITGGGALAGKVGDKIVAVVKGSPPGQMPGPKNP